MDSSCLSICLSVRIDIRLRLNRRDGPVVNNATFQESKKKTFFLSSLCSQLYSYLYKCVKKNCCMT